eukprot:scaffold5170_cov200-Alexandrium_tamarense.AAC.5
MASIVLSIGVDEVFCFSLSHCVGVGEWLLCWTDFQGAVDVGWPVVVVIRVLRRHCALHCQHSQTRLPPSSLQI